MKENPKVFISYAHDTEEFADKILDFSNRLREDGIDASIDQYEESPPEGWPRWMESQIRESDYILVICTKAYYEKAIGSQNGRGVSWEVNIVYQHIYDAYTNNTKFIPVIFDGSRTDDVIIPLKGATIYQVDEVKEYEKLKDRLRGIKRIEKPSLGTYKSLPKLERRKVFVTTFIDIELWDKAKWKGIVYLFATNDVPIIGILCENKIAIETIFGGWIKTQHEDEFLNDMKISIIEGEIPGEDPGYSVHIGTDLNKFVNRLNRNPETEVINEEFIFTISRFQRMNPLPGNNNLELFKKLFAEFKYCYLIPAFYKDVSKSYMVDNIDYDLDYKIKYKNIRFMNVEDISKDDLEISVLNIKK